MKHVKVVKKGNDIFEMFRQSGNNKTYSMKSLGCFVINEIPYTSFDLNGLPDHDRQQISHYMNKGKMHHAKRKWNI